MTNTDAALDVLAIVQGWQDLDPTARDTLQPSTLEEARAQLTYATALLALFMDVDDVTRQRRCLFAEPGSPAS